jgi:hypothetical protein
MEAIRADVVERIVGKLVTLESLRDMRKDLANFVGLSDSNEEIAKLHRALANKGRHNYNSDMLALDTIASLIVDSLADDIWSDIEQFASLFARDVIANDVRLHGNDEPIVMLTGNRFMPAYRSWDEIDAIWASDIQGEYIHEMWERIERKAEEHNIVLGSPEYDNCIYGVDTSKWEPSEAAEKEWDVDNLGDLWSRIDPEPSN